MSLMTEIIKFPTIENEEVCITIEDAKYICLESKTVASILAGKLREEDYANPRYGGKDIILAVKFCKKWGKIKHRRPQPSESKSDTNNHSGPLVVETKCKEVDKEAWVGGFIQIDKYGLGMVHELLAVSNFLLAFRLTDLTCQCIFDYLTFKDYRDFRKAFAFQFLLKPYFSGEERQDMENVLDCILELPTLDNIHTEFKDKIPFTPDELELAESENKSLRVGGNVEYKTNKRSIEELLIKVEYIIRRLCSFQSLSFWMNNAYSKCITESFTYVKEYFDDPSNNDIGELCLTLETASTFHPYFMIHLLQGAIAQKIANPSRSYEHINVIEDDMDKIESEMAAEANLHKRKAEESCKGCGTNWQKDHPHHKDKVFPHLTCFLENRYQEIYCVLGSLRGWMSSHEVQYKFRKLNICNKTTFECAYDRNEDQDEDVENEEQNEDNNEDEGSEILAFICKEKFNLYMRASEQGTRRSMIDFAENKEEFDRIMKETDQKFGDRGPVIEEVKKKYFLHYRKFHYAMVDETKRQMELYSKYANGSQENVEVSIQKKHEKCSI